MTQFRVVNDETQIARPRKNGEVSWQRVMNVNLSDIRCVCGGPDGNGVILSVTHSLDGETK